MFAAESRARRDRKAAINVLKRAMKRYGWPWSIVTELKTHISRSEDENLPRWPSGVNWRLDSAEASHLVTGS
jgi:hypothetical protein